MTPTTVARLPLNQIASQQQDAIVFDVSQVSTIGADPAFLIFYLSKEDEHNGYGTVIQLDTQTKQAAIYSDLNPEYTYLFYKNDQGQLSTLLWCIEVATQTADGLFIAHAKSYGRGISNDDLKRFKQVDLPENQPAEMHNLAESYTPAPQPTQTAGAPTASPATAMAAPTPAQPAPMSAPTMTANLSESPAPQPTASTPSVQSMPASPTPPVQNTVQTQPFPSATNPEISPNTATVPNEPLTNTTQSAQAALAQATSPAPITIPSNQVAPTQTVAPTPQVTPPTQTLSFTDEPLEVDSAPDLELSLPPLPQPQASSTQQITQPPIPAVNDILQPIMPPAPTVAPPQPTSQPSPQPNAASPKQPVGRPPKPLIQDQLWPVSPEDFIWVKNMSRQPINDFKEVLHQKAVQQIRSYKPGLMEDWQFTGMFEQAFAALCTTYELIPALRHDILKALLNGRVVENIKRSQPQAPSAY